MAVGNQQQFDRIAGARGVDLAGLGDWHGVVCQAMDDQHRKGDPGNRISWRNRVEAKTDHVLDIGQNVGVQRPVGNAQRRRMGEGSQTDHRAQFRLVRGKQQRGAVNPRRMAKFSAGQPAPNMAGVATKTIRDAAGKSHRWPRRAPS